MMSIPTVEQFQTEVLAVGGTLILETEEGWSHPTTCEQSYTDQRLDWLFSWRRGSSTGINATTSITPLSASIYDLYGRKVSASTKGIYLIDGRKVIVK
jgi:hypothetical protein